MWRAVPQASQGHICHNRFLFFRGTGSLCVSAKFAGTGISQDSDIRSAGMFANCRISPADAMFLALSWNRVGSVVRGLWFCSGTGGNIHCRKDSPCSTRAKVSCIRGRLARASGSQGYVQPVREGGEDSPVPSFQPAMKERAGILPGTRSTRRIRADGAGSVRPLRADGG